MAVEYKRIEDYPDYLIGSDGTVISTKFGKHKTMSLQKNKQGYLDVRLRKPGEYRIVKIHRLVAQAFIANPDNKREVNHINSIKSDNNVDNLEWMTPKENTIDARDKGLHPNCKINMTIANTIRYLRNTKGLKLKEIGNIFGLKEKAISDIALNKRWSVI